MRTQPHRCLSLDLSLQPPLPPTCRASHPALPPSSLAAMPAFQHALPPCCLCVPQVGPRGLEFAKYSIDYHYIRNYLFVKRYWGEARAAQHIPAFARKIVQQYDQKGEISARLKLPVPPGPGGPFPKK